MSLQNHKYLGYAFVLSLIFLMYGVQSFSPLLSPKMLVACHGAFSVRSTCVASSIGRTSRTDVAAAAVDDANDEEKVAPGNMRVGEIKAELELRKVDFSDCIDKESLAERLKEARAVGKADPEILDRFNKQNLEQQFDPEKRIDIRDQDLDAAVANDGKLPGGMSPDQFKSLAESPEIMALLQNTKMQEAMKIMMTGGREKLEEKLQEDPELQEIVKALDKVINGP